MDWSVRDSTHHRQLDSLSYFLALLFSIIIFSLNIFMSMLGGCPLFTTTTDAMPMDTG